MSGELFDYVQARGPPDALRLEIRGHPVWLMVTAQAVREPRSLQGVASDLPERGEG